MTTVNVNKEQVEQVNKERGDNEEETEEEKNEKNDNEKAVSPCLIAYCSEVLREITNRDFLIIIDGLYHKENIIIG